MCQVQGGLGARRAAAAALFFAVGVPVDAQIVRSSTLVGESRYLVAQQSAHTAAGLDNYMALGITASGCTGFFAGGPPDHLLMRNFDLWARPEFAAWNVAPNYHGFPANGARGGAFSCVTWYENGVDLGYIRTFDSFGEPHGGATSYVTTSAPSEIEVAISDSLAVVAYSDLVSGSNVDLFVHVFTPYGESITNFAFAEPLRREQNHSLTLQADGGIMVGYIRTDLNPDSGRRAVVRRIDPDFTVHAFIMLSTQSAESIYVRAQADSTILAVYTLRISSEVMAAFVQRLDPTGQPIGPATPIDPGYRRVAATTDGRLALVGGGFAAEPWWIRLYDSDLQPVGGRFTPIIQPVTEPYTFFDNGTPVSYADDGSIWITWFSNGGFSFPLLTTLTPYLPGDMNFDGVVNNFDIDPFVAALTDATAYEAQYGVPAEAGVIIGDVNFDGALSNFDIDPFVACLVAGGCP